MSNQPVTYSSLRNSTRRPYSGKQASLGGSGRAIFTIIYKHTQSLLPCARVFGDISCYACHGSIACRRILNSSIIISHS